MKPLTSVCLAILALAGAAPAWAQLPAMRDRPLSAAERTRLASLETDITRIAAQRNTSAAAVRAIARKLGTRLTTSDPAQIIKAIDDRAAELAGARTRINDLERELETLDSARLIRAVQPLLEAASQAIDEGELDAAEARLVEAGDQFGQARTTLAARVDDLAGREADILAQRAAVRSAGFDYQGAADLFAQAAELTPQAQTRKRWMLRMDQANAFMTLGDEMEEPGALERAIALYRETVLPLSARADRPDDWAATQANLGRALGRLGYRKADRAMMREGITAQRLYLEVAETSAAPDTLAAFRTALASSMRTLGQAENDSAMVAEAAGLLEQVVAFGGADLHVALSSLANTQTTLALMGGDETWLVTAMATHDRAVAAIPADETAFVRAGAWSNRALANLHLAIRRNTPEAWRTMLGAVDEAIAQAPRGQAPGAWATLKRMQGFGLTSLSALDDGAEGRGALEQALASFAAANEVLTREASLTEWAALQMDIGRTLRTLGARDRDQARLAEAVRTYRAASDAISAEALPMYHASSRAGEGGALADLASVLPEGERAHVRRDAEAALAAARVVAEPLAGAQSLLEEIQGDSERLAELPG